MIYMKIYKYKLELKDFQQIPLSYTHKILDVQIQDGSICLWAAIKPGWATSHFPVHIIGTGQELPDRNLQYCGTVQLDGFVWHIFIEY